MGTNCGREHPSQSCIRSRCAHPFRGCPIDHGYESQRKRKRARSSRCRFNDYRGDEPISSRVLWQRCQHDHRRLPAGLSRRDSHSGSMPPLLHLSLAYPGMFAQAARKAALGAAPTAYSYIYSWRTPVLDNRPGSFHASEISFVFDNADICDHYSGGDPAAFVLSKQMSTAWANFARTGNPNHPGLPHWPAYTTESGAAMYFGRTVRGAERSRGKRAEAYHAVANLAAADASLG